ncbi:MAG: hypothetical protein IJD59_01525 [Clostridia bacterium]|nr:hypothetical protein [Clostridia bacterium]
MRDLEKIEMHGGRAEEFQKRYNERSKGLANIIGKNLTLFLCLLLPFLLIGFIWTEFGAVEIGPKLLSDGVLTVSLFVVGEVMMTRLGADGGKLDAEYIGAKSDYEALVVRAGEVGALLMGIFCDWQIDLEMKQAVRSRLRALRMTEQTWNEIKDLPADALVRRYGRAKARKLMEIRTLKPIELNEAILLYDGGALGRGGVPVSAEEYLRNRVHFIKTLAACLFTGLLTVTVAVTLTSDITFARVIYTVFKLVMLVFRMAKGYDRGARAYNTVEVRQYRAKSNYLRAYIGFVTDGLYRKLGDQYGDPESFIGDPLTSRERET